jgi:CspA family cold shock protein
MPQGTIKKLVADRGFGFISGDQRGDVFFHHSSVAGGAFDDLREGQSVEFEIENDADRGRGKGPRASNVRPAS